MARYGRYYEIKLMTITDFTNKDTKDKLSALNDLLKKEDNFNKADNVFENLKNNLGMNQ